jgi:hypothetical protein
MMVAAASGVFRNGPACAMAAPASVWQTLSSGSASLTVAFQHTRQTAPQSREPDPGRQKVIRIEPTSLLLMTHAALPHR